MSESTAKLDLTVKTDEAQRSLSGLTSKLKESGAAADEAKKKSKSFADTLKDGLKDVTDRVNSYSDAFGKLAAAGQAAAEMAKFSAELKQLEKNVPITALQGMQTATAGTVAKMDLLRFASKALSGEFHLTTTGLEVVTRAATNLHAKGFGPTLEIAEKLTEALRKGETEALAGYGMHLKATADKAGAVAEALKAVQREASAPINVDPSLQAVDRLAAKAEDFKTVWKAAIGEIATSLGVLIDKALSSGEDAMVRNRRRVRAEGIYGKNTTGSTGNEYLDTWRKQIGIGGVNLGGASDEQAIKGVETNLALQDAQTANALVQFYSIQGSINHKIQKYLKLTAGKMPSSGGGARTPGNLSLFSDLSNLGAGIEGAGARADYGLSYGLPGYVQSLPSLTGGKFAASANSAYGTGTESAFDGGGYGGGSVFGNAFSQLDSRNSGQDKLAEFSQQLQDQNSLVGKSFGALTDGLSAAVDAAISGEESITRAFGKAVAAKLKAIALESTVKAAFELAEGIAASYWAPAEAAKHYAAAAQYAATAVLAGAGSATLGALSGGGSSGGGGARPSAANYVGGTAQQSGAQNITVYVSLGQSLHTKGEIAEAVSQSIDTAKRQGRMRSDANAVVRYE